MRLLSDVLYTVAGCAFASLFVYAVTDSEMLAVATFIAGAVITYIVLRCFED
jgi:hypothetical protein